ncbi:rab3 GTPase-activating protein catalytic subunit isoform X3 [Phalaenopsis equestris]|uniref:rab3 GTPase-activating protein catalytic subunit isoform X3 n=1 Tax=Phalaenopsis equestris TaxID=78828 RepID=UPI0009E21393|nr:rab3 GTPase-activating protein catalytic subunit isoform X3 [Phalaenopsis equestris]
MDRGKAVQEVGEDVEETQEIEGFDDFTIASTWERFISEIEAVCRQWFVDGHKNLLDKGAECLGSRNNLYRMKRELKHGVKLYTMEYYFQIHSSDKAGQWDNDLHSLQLSFGVTGFLVIAPLSASGVVLDAPESSKLLSAVAIALSNCGSNWPAFVPVHDPSRKAYIGIQNMSTTFTRRFNSDRIGSQVPVRLLHLEGLYELFVSKFALTAVDFSTNCFSVRSTMRLSYRTPPYADDNDEGQDNINKQRKGDAVEDNHIKSQWDSDCPWAEWYSSEDPIKVQVTSAQSSWRGGEKSHACLIWHGGERLVHFFLYAMEKRYMLHRIDDSIGKSGFALQLSLLISALDKSFEAKYLEDFVSAENSGSDISKTLDFIPPPAVVDRILKEIFHDGVESWNHMDFEGRNSRFIKGAPLGSLFAQFCLHALWLGNCNIRAIATLWIEFVREVRWCWEESQPLPKMSASSNIDLTTCLVHQKLQMLAICIEKKNLIVHEHQNGVEREDSVSNIHKVDLHDPCDQSHDMIPKDSLDNSSSQKLVVQHDLEETLVCSSIQGHETRSGDLLPKNYKSAGVVESMMLLHSFQNMHSPIIQDAPPMTEDMHEERLRAAEVFGNLSSLSGQLERDILSSDMSAFKAANPDSVFEDFIRWHSPGDWESDETEDKSMQHTAKSTKPNWPPKGRLSQRMAEHGSSWRQIWNTSPAMPSSEQRPLLDPIREAEKILHYLETLKPHQLLEQMVCTAFGASADTLSQTKFGDLRLLKAKIDQLYSTLSSTLKSLQVIHVPDRVELIGDLKQLCVVFEHIEKLVILAASMYRKLSDAPRLSEAIFQDYFDFYQPKMGTGLASLCYDKDFNMKQVVKPHERDVIASFFPPPTASQSWRKVLSMGNLLFGHEPILREIIFSVSGDVSNGQYSGGGHLVASIGDIETHRMYIRGTSNDLRVALSVTSWD